MPKAVLALLSLNISTLADKVLIKVQIVLLYFIQYLCFTVCSIKVFCVAVKYCCTLKG